MRIPNELKLMFGDNLVVHDINTLSRTSQELYWLFTPYLYRRAMHLRAVTARPYFLVAVDSGNHVAINKFLAVGTSVDMRHDEHRLATSLHSSAVRGDIGTAKLLIQKGIDVSAINLVGETPLHLAVARKSSNEAMVRLLADAGANLFATTESSLTILSSAARYGSTSIVRILLEHGADGTIVGSGKQTPLHAAALHGSVAVVRLLLAAGQDHDARDSSGNTPLHCAVYSGSVEKVHALLYWGAIVSARNNSNDTPLHEAVIGDGSHDDADRIIHHALGFRGRCPKSCVPVCRFAGRHDSMVGQLLLGGADIIATNNDGICPLDWAMVRLHLG
jgi:ankyrin repeat protein